MDDLKQQASQQQSNRKKEHIYHFLNGDFDSDTLFGDVYLPHNALPEIDFGQINTKSSFLGKTVDFPLMINAMTGGFDRALEINGHLSSIAAAFNMPMAVGSQSIAIKDPAYAASFKVVRKNMKQGVVIANINGFATLDQVKAAVDMVEADGVQIHLNPAQEICMPEGDRDFTGVLKRIEAYVRYIEKPVIVKEVGFGLSEEVVQSLVGVGVKHLDIGGAGGTNFIKIESARNEAFDFPELADWGIPTALSLYQARRVTDGSVKIISSGGMRRADEVVKALVLGADMIGISGPILRCLMEEGLDATHDYIQNLHYKSKIIMLLLGKGDLESLRQVPYRLKGTLAALVGGGSCQK